MVSWVAPARSSRWPAGSRFWSAMASSRCSVETNSSLKRVGLVEGALQNLVQRLGEVHAGLHARWSLGRLPSRRCGFGDDGVGMHAALFEHGPDDAFLFLGQGDEQVEREHDLVFVLFGDGLGLLHGFLRFLSEFVESKHLVS